MFSSFAIDSAKPRNGPRRRRLGHAVSLPGQTRSLQVQGATPHEPGGQTGPGPASAQRQGTSTVRRSVQSNCYLR